jgi:2-keto-4-pentenoate hydratase
MAAAVWEDERVVRGMGVHLQAQRDKGGTRIGWKMGLGLPAVMERLGTTGPLVAELRDGTLVESGGSLSVDGWARPVFEPEVAVFFGTDVEPGGDREAAAAAISAMSAAIEMVDLPSPPTDPGAVLEGGFAHRAVILGARDETRAGGDFSGLSSAVTSNGEPLASEDDPQRAVGGDLLGLVRHAADYLGAFGERLAAGQFLITGSTIAPPPQVGAGQHLVFELGGVGTVEVTLT